jgi:hypothetical protein
VRIKSGQEHTIVNLINEKFIELSSGTEMWCAMAYSRDHTGFKSLILFNHSIIATFKLDSEALKYRWSIVDNEGHDWRAELQVLQASYINELVIYVDGTLPAFVPVDMIYKNN